MSKGSQPRPHDKNKFNKNFDLIFNKRKEKKMNNRWESLEEFIYQNCNKNTLNFDEYESKYGVDLRKHLDIQGIKKCINKLNKTNHDNA